MVSAGPELFLQHPSFELQPPFPYWIVGVSLTVLLVILLIVITTRSVLRQKTLERALKDVGLSMSGTPVVINPNLPLVEQAQMLPLDKRWEFPTKHLKVGPLLGAGEFGVVMQGEASFIVEGETITTVAIKMVKGADDKANMRALATELKIMAHLGQHLNVVNLLGVCTKDIVKGQLMVIVEFCSFGNMRDHLLQNRNNTIRDELEASDRKNSSTSGSVPDVWMEPVEEKSKIQTVWKSSNQQVQSAPPSEKDLLCWSYQVAKGMEYLSSRKVMHGDLAARNVLLADNNVVKICDFGLSRSLNYSNYYRKNSEDMLPVRWLAPEALLDQIFSTQSDVWSFGILLWEFYSLGSTPYPGVMNSELITKIREGYRMEKPKLASEEVYLFMNLCWQTDPNDRPNFSALACDLGNLLGVTVVDQYLSLNSPYTKLNEKLSGRDYLSEMRAPDFSKCVKPSEKPTGSNVKCPPPLQRKDTRL